INGTASQASTWLDDQPVGALTKTESLGTTGVGRVQVGENITGRTYDLALDDITITTPDTVAPSVPSRLVVSASGAGALVSWSAEQSTLDRTMWFKVLSFGANVVDVAKLRTGSGAALLTVFVSPTGVLGYQNNVTTVSTYSTTPVSQAVWHKLVVRTVINGTASQVSTWLDDQPVGALTTTECTGTTAVDRRQ